jgi:hypothetical protein
MHTGPGGSRDIAGKRRTSALRRFKKGVTATGKIATIVSCKALR